MGPHLPDARAQRLLQPPGRRRTAAQQAGELQTPWLAPKHSVATMGIDPWTAASAQPETPTIVDQNLDRFAAFIAEDENASSERITVERLATNTG